MHSTWSRIEASPGAVNIIPGQVAFTVDLRALTDARQRLANRAAKDGIIAAAAN